MRRQIHDFWKLDVHIAVAEFRKHSSILAAFHELNVNRGSLKRRLSLVILFLYSYLSKGYSISTV
jgi:uncharacterized protein (UPF0332 family)